MIHYHGAYGYCGVRFNQGKDFECLSSLSTCSMTSLCTTRQTKLMRCGKQYDAMLYTHEENRDAMPFHNNSSNEKEAASIYLISFGALHNFSSLE